MKKISSPKLGLLSASLLASSVIGTAAANAQETPAPSSFKEAIAASKPIFQSRLRLETVEQDGFDEDAEALTYRFRVGVETGAFMNTKALIEFDHVEDILDDFNSGPNGNGKGQFPVVADPQVTEVNRLQLTNTSFADTKITAGRQIIALDDHRFIGHVGWRQDIQTFDALRITNESFGDLKLDVGYIAKANRIFGENADWEGDSYFINASYPTPLGKLTGFGYFVDIEEAAALSSQTLGVRFAGGQEVGPGKFDYILSYATQSDWGSSPSDYSADYYLLDGSYKVGKFKGGIGYEVLGADDGGRFTTPFATLHKFNGFADKFLGTPGDGLEDLYVSAGYFPGDVGPFKGTKVVATYHDFSAESASTDFGSEFNLVVAAKWNVLGLLIKYADYSADEFATDTSKLWLQVDYAF